MPTLSSLGVSLLPGLVGVTLFLNAVCQTHHATAEKHVGGVGRGRRGCGMWVQVCPGVLMDRCPSDRGNSRCRSP